MSAPGGAAAARPSLAVAALVGLAAGLLVLSVSPGLRVLLDPPPGHTMPHRDAAMALAGALAFVEDAWRWPLFDFEGLSVRETNAVFTDSIPLHALVWKIASGGTRAGFEHFLGAWLAVLLALQGAAGAAGLRLLGVTARGALFAGALLFALFPAFLYRVPIHAALSAHGLVILALAMMLAPPRAGREGARTLGWGALLVAAALIHGYLLVMALACFSVSVLAALAGPGEDRRARILLRAAAALAAMLGVMAAAGYFSGPPSGAGGFGLFRLNLAAPLQHGGGSLLPEIVPLADHEDSGYAYVPLGLWALFAAAAWLALARPAAARPPTLLARPAGAAPVALGTLAVLLFATAGRLAVGAQELLAIPLPEALEPIARMLRASGRFVWLPGYGALLLAVAAVALCLPPVRAGALLGALALAVAVEMTPLRRGLAPEPGPYASDPVLARLVAEADRLAIVPPWGCDPDHIPALDKELHFLAARGRTLIVNGLAAARVARDCRSPLPEGFLPVPEGGALLIVKHAGRGLGPLSRLAADESACRAHLGLALCRRGWPSKGPGSALPPVPAERLATPLRLDFRDNGTAIRHLGRGFARPEPWGVWSLGEEAEIELALAPGSAPRRLLLRLRGYVPAARPETAAEAVLLARGAGGHWREEARARVAFSRAAPRRSIVLPRPAVPAERLRILLRPEAPASPAGLGSGTDARRLGVGITALVLD